MIKSLILENFRAFSSIKVEGICPVTILGGRNNSGKSTILESIFFHFGWANPQIFLPLFVLRNVGIPLRTSPQALWAPLFYGFQKSKSMTLSVEREQEVWSQLHVKKVRDPHAGLNVNEKEIGNILKQGFDAGQVDDYFFALHCEYSVGDKQIQGMYSIQGDKISLEIAISNATQIEKP